MTKVDQQRVRRIIREAKWQPASSPQYRNAPHQYIIRQRQKDSGIERPDWDWFASLIRKECVYRIWRGNRYCYLFLGRKAYWVDWAAINRADRSTLEQQTLGYPRVPG